MEKPDILASLHQSSVSHNPSEIILYYADLLVKKYVLLLLLLLSVWTTLVLPNICVTIVMIFE